MTDVLRCPTCKKPIGPTTPRFAPFCSERCKMIDLGRWFDGEFSVPGEPADVAEALEQPRHEGDEDEER